jgi:hypothetical protein
VHTIQERATATFRDWARMPKEKARHHLMFGGIAWARQPAREGLQVLVCFVSNCHDELGHCRLKRVTTFAYTTGYLIRGSLTAFSLLEQRSRLRSVSGSKRGHARRRLSMV